MKVKFLMAIAGNVNAYKGEVKEVENKEAKRLIEAQICEEFFAQPTEVKGKRNRIHTR